MLQQSPSHASWDPMNDRAFCLIASSICGGSATILKAQRLGELALAAVNREVTASYASLMSCDEGTALGHRSADTSIVFARVI
jgi:hypothetical protein